MMRQIVLTRTALALGVALLLPSGGLAQVTLNQIDTFETGSTLNWGGGPALAVAAGGPGGANDHFLRVTATGAGIGGKLTTFNRTQWVGNYISAGVNAIEMDLMAPPSSTQLAMRIAFKTDTSNFSSGYSTAVAFALPNDGQWHHAIFRLSDADLTPVNGAFGPPPPLNTLLTGPGELRILHSALPSLHGDNIVAVVGIDNIRASFNPVPEPTGLLAAAACAAGVARWARRRKAGG